MAQSLIVVATEPGSGKSAICLGLLDQFARHGIKAGYFKPVAISAGPSDVDPDVRLLHVGLDISRPMQAAAAVSANEVTEAVQSGGYSGIMDRILDAHGQVAEGMDLILCEGVDSVSAFPALESDINVDIARNLDSSMVLVTTGENRSVEEVTTNVAVARQGLVERGGRVLGVIVNRVQLDGRESFTDALRWQLQERGINLFGVVPTLAELSYLRMVDVGASLQAKVLAGEAHLQNHIGSVVVAAMSLDNALHYFADRALIITPADREEIVLAAAASYAASDAPVPAGLVLTGGLETRQRVMHLARSLSGDQLPILKVKTPTFETAVAVHHIKPLMTADQEQKVAAIREAMEEYVDVDQLLEERLKPTQKILTPKRFLRELRDQARANRRTVVLPESDVDRILQATGEIRAADAAKIILLGSESEVRDRARMLGVELDSGVVVVDPRTDNHFDEYAATLHELRKHKGMTEEKARELMADRTYFATMMVHQGRAHGMVSGATTTTAETIRPALTFIKTKPDFSSVSSIFFMCLPDRVLVYGDCAVIPNPTAEQLAEIALTSAETARAFGIDPRVAMLSYSTGQSGTGPDVEAVREATRLVRERNPALSVEGPIQYDAAVDVGVARTKLPRSSVAGRATVFIFPDLNTGNNTYKAVQRSSGAIAIGPVLQGLNKPVNDLSRGATVVDIVNTVIVTAIQSQAGS